MPLPILETNQRTQPLKFAGELFLLDGLSALYWAKHQMLIISDLHFEKGSYLGQFANPLPHYDTSDTLQRIEQLVADYQPKTVVCLGDSFHDVAAVSRLDKYLIAGINQLCNGVENWVWVLGNHDPEIPQNICGQRKSSLYLDNILLVHEPEEENCAQIIGHFHPKATHKVTGQKLRGKCFLSNEHRLLMPAFGTYTGGLAHDHKVIKHVMRQSQPVHIHFIYNEKLWKL